MRILRFSAMWLAIVACVDNETGVDDYHVRGTVQIPATRASESGDNGTYDKATALPPVGLGYTVVDATIDGWGNAADEDWYEITASAKATQVVQIRFGDELEGTALGSTDTGYYYGYTYDTGGGDTTDLYVEWYNLGDPAPFKAWREITDGLGEIQVDLAPNTTYYLRVVGVAGHGEVPYRVLLPGVDPRDVGIRVGAYTSSDLTNLGYPVGGGEVTGLYVDEDYAWNGDYEMNYVRSVTSTPSEAQGDTAATIDVDENLDQVYLVAATWPNLDNGLHSGNLYSSAPVALPLDPKHPHVALDAPIVLDAVAEAQAGFTVAEVEPNDLGGDFYSYDWDFSQAQDLGTLSGAGYVDTVTGTVEIRSASPGWGAQDIDVYAFTTPEPSSLFLTLAWDDPAADVDLLVLDALGYEYDDGGMYTTSNPEAGTATIPDDATYYLVVLGYAGVEGTAPAYSLTIEE